MTNEVLRTDSDFPQHSEGQPVEWPTISHSITNNCRTNVQRYPIQRQRCFIGQTVSCRSRAKFHTVVNDIPHDDEWFFRKGHEDFFEICISLPLQFSNIVSHPLWVRWDSMGYRLASRGTSFLFYETSLVTPCDIIAFYGAPLYNEIHVRISSWWSAQRWSGSQFVFNQIQ